MAKMTMGHAVKRWWKYTAAWLHVAQDTHADPKVQLEQAIAEARESHRVLTQQAANVIGYQRQAQLRLERAITEHAKVDAATGQGLVLADQAARAGDAEKAARFAVTAEMSAARAIALETEIRDLEQGLLQATAQAEQAKAAVVQNAAVVQQKLAQREQLLSTLDQAKVQEAINAAMQQINATVGDDVPTFEQVRLKIEARLGQAQGMAEITAGQADMHVQARMVELERAQSTLAAQARIAAMREQLGLPAALEAGPTDTAPEVVLPAAALRAVDEV